MPWSTPTLRTVRGQVRDYIQSTLPGSDANVPNSVLRVLSDSQGGLCHLTLQYIDWLALQLLPDTAETEWLDRHGKIWLVNADGSTGRKLATLSTGEVTFTGTIGVAVPAGTQLSYANGQLFETTGTVAISSVATPAPIRALDPGSASNLTGGSALLVIDAPAGVDATAYIVVNMQGGADEETDEELRARVLRRIRQPPMGGAVYDYEQWALAVPGVTRAWATTEMGIGTVTVRFMMDDLRADNGGFPLDEDIQAVTDYLNIVRPVTVKDLFVESPIPFPIDFNLADLVPDTADIVAAIEVSCRQMIMALSAPGQTIFVAWKYGAVINAPGVQSFILVNNLDDIMPSPGHMAVLGDIYWNPPMTAPQLIGPPSV